MRKPPQDEVWIQFAGDGCSAGRYQQTAIAFRLMGMQGVESNSPFNTYSIVLFEGDDGYNAIASYVERMVHETNELTAHGMQIQDKRYTFKLWGGGDLKFLNGIFGLSTCAHTYGCPFCVVHKGKLHKPDPCLPRRLPRCVEMAHEASVPFTCRGCKATFNNKAEINAANPKNDSQRLKWQIEHEGQRPHAAPLLPIDPY